MIYEWQAPHWARLLEDLDRLPHALLLAGPAGVGKRDFATALALRLLCSRARGPDEACGECPSCRWAAAANHPDLLLVVPEADQDNPAGEAETGEAAPRDEARKGKPSRQIRIDQIRALGDVVAVGTHQGGRRVIIVQPAEAMNTATANALLKLLEEPPATTTFILVSNAPSRLLPTVRSRCRRVSFGRPAACLARAWLAAEGMADAAGELAYSGGHPLAARGFGAATAATRPRAAVVAALAQGGALDPVAFAAVCESFARAGEGAGPAFGLAQLVDCVQKWVVDLIRSRAGLPARYFVAEAERLARTAAGLPGGPLFDCYNYLVKIKPYVEHPLNARLFIEDLLIRYARAVTPAGGR